MDSYEILTTDFGISKLMNVRHRGTRDRACRTFATCVVTQTLLFVECKDGLPHKALVNSDNSVRTVVVVNRCLLARPPADHQHFDRVIAANSMTPVITFLEPYVRL